VHAGQEDHSLDGQHQDVDSRHETGSHFVTQRLSDPGIQRPGDPVDPVTLFYNKLQTSTYVCKSSLLLLEYSVQYLIDYSSTQQGKKSNAILGIFSKTTKTRVLHRVKMMTR